MVPAVLAGIEDGRRHERRQQFDLGERWTAPPSADAIAFSAVRRRRAASDEGDMSPSKRRSTTASPSTALTARACPLESDELHAVTVSKAPDAHALAERRPLVREVGKGRRRPGAEPHELASFVGET
jgi:hypothetical protein